jgi:GNAT superfamily N-acetyltransferase
VALQSQNPEEINWKMCPTEVHYLRMEARDIPEFEPDPGLEVRKMMPPYSAENYLKLYRAVGDAWNWLDRLTLPPAELEGILNQAGTEILCFFRDGEFLGYGELVPKTDAVEIQYFGLVPAATGKGLGWYFFRVCLKRAWEMGKRYFQLNTCSLDHPKALSFYQRAGFSLLETRIEERKVPLLP